MQLQQKSDDAEKPDNLEIVLESGIKVIQGRSIELVDPNATLNGRKISQRILQGVIGSINERLSLKKFEKQGIIARLLELNFDNKEINLAAFVRLEPEVLNVEKSRIKSAIIDRTKS